MKHETTSPLSIGYAFCGSFCTVKYAIEAMKTLTEQHRVTPIFSEAAQTINTRFGKAEAIMKEIEAISGNHAIKTIAEAERIGPEKLFDILVIAPCTGNTLSKLSLGIIDSTVAMAAKAHLRNARPLLLAIASNDALSVGLRHIGALTLRKNIFFVPFGQDDPFEKPTSLIADFSKIPKAISAAMENKQLQPILLGS